MMVEKYKYSCQKCMNYVWLIHKVPDRDFLCPYCERHELRLTTAPDSADLFARANAMKAKPTPAPVPAQAQAPESKPEPVPRSEPAPAPAPEPAKDGKQVWSAEKGELVDKVQAQAQAQAQEASGKPECFPAMEPAEPGAAGGVAKAERKGQKWAEGAKWDDVHPRNKWCPKCHGWFTGNGFAAHKDNCSGIKPNKDGTITCPGCGVAYNPGYFISKHRNSCKGLRQTVETK